MTARKPAKKAAKKAPARKAGAAVPVQAMDERKRAEEWLSKRSFKAYPEMVGKRCARLITDDRMRAHWGRGFDFGDFQESVRSLDKAASRDDWDRKTQAARNEWLERFNGTLDLLKMLMMEGPRTPIEWGFPVRSELLMHSLRAVVDLPEQSDRHAFYSRMFDLEHQLDRSGMTIIHALEHYQLQVNSDAEAQQVLRKPADPKADRALFITLMARYTSCADSVIGDVTAILFDDDAEDLARVVRRLRTGR